jgi:RNA-directed DNA polymerase
MGLAYGRWEERPCPKVITEAESPGSTVAGRGSAQSGPGARWANHLQTPQVKTSIHDFAVSLRPGCGCHDAIESLFNTLKGKSARVWILDADLASAFDKISHEHLLGMLGGFPAKGMIAGWLRAGVFEAGKGFAPAGEGLPRAG